MRIVRVGIQNFRCIDSFVWHPRERSVLVGENNCGKSTVLRALELALSPAVRLYEDSFSEYDFHRRDRSRPIVVDVTFGHLDEEAGEVSLFADCLEPGTDPDSLRAEADSADVLDTESLFLRMRLECSHSEDDHEYHPVLHFPKWDTKDHLVTAKQKDAVGFEMIHAQREAERTFGFARYSVLGRLLSDVNIRPQAANMAEQAGELAALLLGSADFAGLVSQLAQEADAVVPLAGSQPGERLSFELSDLSERGILHTLELFLRTELCGGKFPISRQGAGVRNAVVLAGLLLLAKKRKTAGKRPTLIMAVEEPEISLHPHAQRYLLSELQRNATQLIVTTHSPTVAQAFAISDLDLLRRTGGTVTESHIPPVQDNAVPFHKQLSLRLPGELADAYFSKGVLLVEGPTDRVALLEFSRTLCAGDPAFSLDRLGVCVVAAGGIEGIAPLATAIRDGLGIPVAALYDRKPGDDAAVAGIQANADLSLAMPVPSPLIDPPESFSDLEGLICYQAQLPQLMRCVADIHSVTGDKRSLCEWMLARLGGSDQELLTALLDTVEGKPTEQEIGPALETIEGAGRFDKPRIRKALKLAFFSTNKTALCAGAWAGAFAAADVPEGIREILTSVRQLHPVPAPTPQNQSNRHVQVALDTDS